MKSVEIQRQLSKEVEQVLGRDAIKAYQEKSLGHTLFTVAHLWLAIFASFWLGAKIITLPLLLALPLGLLLAFFVATRINALNVLVHEGSHYCLAPDRKLNDWLTNYIIGYWILFDVDSYRSVHFKHHRLLNEPEDPDLPLYAISNKKWHIARDFLFDFFWVSLAKRALVYKRQGLLFGKGNKPSAAQTKTDSKSDKSVSATQHLIAKLGCNFIILLGLMACFGFLNGIILCALFWVFPLFSIYPMIIRIRIITEHFSPEIITENGELPSVFISRTSVCGPIEHYLFGAQMDYHFEHHLLPAIPYHQCKRMHKELIERGFFDTEHENRVSGGYFAFWRRLLASDYFNDRGDSSIELAR